MSWHCTPLYLHGRAGDHLGNVYVGQFLVIATQYIDHGIMNSMLHYSAYCSIQPFFWLTSVISNIILSC